MVNVLCCIQFVVLLLILVHISAKTNDTYLNRGAEDIDLWFNEIENLLATDDTGKVIVVIVKSCWCQICHSLTLTFL